MTSHRAPRRVLYVIGALATGGAERQLLELCSGLDREKWDPLVCALEARGELRADFEAREVDVVELQRHGSFDWKRMWELRRLIEREAPALIHAFLVGPSLYSRIARIGLRPRPPLIVAERTVQARKRRVVRTADWLAAGQADCFVGNAEAVREALQTALHPRRPRIEVIPNGFDVDAIDAAQPREATRALLGWGDETILLFVGRLAAAKDFPTLIEAFSTLENRPGLRLVIAGDGPERPLLERLIRERDLRVSLLGMRRDVPDLLRAADLFVLSSNIEGLPNVVGEALVAELPVAATAAGGVPELVRDGIDGRVVPVGDGAALGAALAELLDDPERARAMARTGGQRIRDEFSLAAMVERTERLYVDLLDEASRR